MTSADQAAPHPGPSCLVNLREVGGEGVQAILRPGRRRVWRANTDTVPASAYPESVGVVVDLRRDDEAEAVPHPLRASAGYVRAPLFDPAAEVEADPAALSALSELSLEQQYDDWIVRHRATIAEALRTISRSQTGDVLVCCAAGKDRTGVISLLLGSLWGASDEVVAADYAATGPNMTERFAQELAESTDIERTRRMHRCGPEIAEHLLGTLTARFGGVRGYLEWLGLTEVEIAGL